MLESKKNEFSLDEGVHYLNCAYMSPIMKSAEKAGIDGLKSKAKPYTITAADFFTNVKALRREFADLIGCKDANRVVTVPSVSYGIASAANNIPGGVGDNIIVVEEQFPSNMYSWREVAAEKKMDLRVVSAPTELKDRGKIWNQRILDAIDQNTCLIAIGNVHWADGTKFDLKSIRSAADVVGALLIIDGSQSVGALPLNISEIRPDALICAGYKWLFGPYSIGMAYYGPVFDGGKPIEHSWINRLNSEDFSGLVRYNDEFEPGALRYGVGESGNFILVPMQLEALRKLNEWKVEQIDAYAKNLIDDFIPEILNKGYVIEDEKYRGNHLIGVRKPGIDVKRLSARLMEKKIYVSVRGEAVRISVSVFNDRDDLQRLVETL